ncbi:Cytochrome P450 9e2 [Eufriesea mexicana]|uniref:Cytochrome P450 9e2 n=1 Tax=Eufriesea mexicana TaxID=516756 RepID=A0A310SPV9_9HYME|nr:Cytochrome P450 9e2 [Eufriesea mexicana]
MIQLMLEAKQKDGKELTIDEMTCQAFVFFIANFDTVSTIVSFAMHELALNPDVQAKLHAEIEEVVEKTNGKPSYELLKAMQYMDAVISETLRLYALLPFLDRVCVKEFQLPPTTPGSRPITIKPGEMVWFLPFALQRDPKYFSNPTKFHPDRFLSKEAHQATYLPFGLGPRICIGNRFALIQCKMALFYLIWRCELEPCEKTAIPLEFSSKSFVLLPKEGFWLNVRSRNKSYRSKTCRGNGKSASSSNNSAGGINLGPVVGGRRPPSQQSFHSSKNHSHHSRHQTTSAPPSTPRNACQLPEIGSRCIRIRNSMKRDFMANDTDLAETGARLEMRTKIKQLGYSENSSYTHFMLSSFLALPSLSVTDIRSSSRNLVSTRNQQSITKMLLLISTVFILLNLPSYVIRLCVFFFTLAHKNTPDLLWCLQQFFMLLYYTNFSINFLLYAMCGITFRRCLQQLLRKVPQKPTPGSPSRYWPATSNRPVIVVA